MGLRTFMLMALGILMLSGCGGAPRGGSAGVLSLTIEEEPSTPLSAAEVAQRMTRSFHSTPVLHVTVLNRHHGVDYECRGWMMEKKSLGVVKKDGKVVFASYSDAKRVQEYVPQAKFVNGAGADSVLLEYDYENNDGGWSRLVDADFDCGPGSIAVASYLWAESRTVPELMLSNMNGATVSEVVFNNRECFRYHLEANMQPNILTWELYVDKATCDPVRESRVIVGPFGNKLKDDIYDYKIEHLPDDAGIHWGLQPDKLKP